MKKILLASSALVAAGGLMIAPAFADSMSKGLKVTTGGYATSGFFYTDSDVPNTSDTSVKFLGEIQFQAETTLDNGLKVGARVELEAQTQSDQIDEHFLFVEGGFGRIVLGADDGAGNAMHYGAPGFVAGNGINSPNFLNIANGAGALTGTNVGLSGDANKVSFYTPRVVGAQFGISYSPKIAPGGGGKNSGGADVASDFTPIAGDENIRDLVSIGLNYQADLGDAAVRLSGGFETAQGGRVTTTAAVAAVDFVAPTETTPRVLQVTAADAVITNRENPILWNVGASIEMSGITVGGSFTQRYDVAGNGVDGQAWGVTGQYTTGPWTVGAGYVRGDRDSGDATATAAEDGAQNNDFNHVQVGGSYDLGSGFQIGLAFDWYDVNKANTTTAAATDSPPVTTRNDEESWALSLLMTASF